MSAKPRAMKWVFVLGLITPFSLIPNFAEATSPEDAPSPQESFVESLEVVTTTARAPIPALASDRSVAVVTAEELSERQPSSLTDAIAEEAGVVRQSTSRGADTVYLRGLIGPENLIYVDGVRFNQSTFRTGPNQYLNTLDPWSMRQIEIIRGPGSVLYGSGAMGGVIELFPRAVPLGSFHIRGLGTYHSVDETLGSSLDIGGRHGPLGISVGTSIRDQGQLRVGTRGGEGIFATAEDDQRMLASDYRERFLRGQVALDISPRSNFRLNYLGGAIDGAQRTDQLGIGQMRVTDNEDDLLWATYRHEGSGAFETLHLNASFHRSRDLSSIYRCHTRPDGPQGRFMTVEDPLACANLESSALLSERRLEDITTTFGTSLVTSHGFDAIPLRLIVGADAYQDRVVSGRRDRALPDEPWREASRGNFSTGSTYTSVGAFASGEYSIINRLRDEFLLRVGLRVENFHAHAPNVTPELGDVDFGYTGAVGSLGLAYLWDLHLNVYLTWNQGFRAPNLQEATVLGDTGNFFEIPNAELRPERNDTFELGFKTDFPRVVTVTGSTFVSLISDRITRADATFDGEDTIAGKPVQQRINAEHAYYYGVEGGLETGRLWGGNLFGTLTYIDGAEQTGAEDASFEPGPLHGLLADSQPYRYPRRLPPLLYRAGLRLEPSTRWYGIVYVEGAASQDRLNAGDLRDLRICEIDRGLTYGDLGMACPGTPSWTTLNARTGYRFTDAGRLDLALTNLTDQRYRHHGSGILAPGLGAMITLVVTQ